MPPSARITFRLTPALEPLVSDRVRQGTPVSDIVREALELYFGLHYSRRPTSDDALSDRMTVLSDTPSDNVPSVSDNMAVLSDTVSDMGRAVSDIQARLGALEARGEAPAAARPTRPTPRQTDRPTPPATPKGSPGPLTPHLQRIAEIAAQYDKMSLAELAQLLFDRGIYRASDRTTGAAKPVNRGTLQRWLEQARQAGVL